MDPITNTMFMGASGEGLKIGQFYQGGYFAGVISYTANGVPTHGLIVAPAATGYNGKAIIQWKTTATNTTGTDSVYDGAANTANMANVSHPAANYCANLNISGYTDWYLPAIYELEIAYYNLKPNTPPVNDTTSGANLYAVPPRVLNYTYGNPNQTNVVDFQTGNSEVFLTNLAHWSSTQFFATNYARGITFGLGEDDPILKTDLKYVRAFRKFAL